MTRSVASNVKTLFGGKESGFIHRYYCVEGGGGEEEEGCGVFFCGVLVVG